MTENDERAERAFRDALSQQADGFEPADTHVPSGRGPARWRSWGSVAAAGVLVAGTAVGVGLVTRHGGGLAGPDGPTTVPQTSQGAVSDLPLPDPGWRYESYRDVVVQVPDSWGSGPAPRSDWCASAGGAKSPYPAEPFVDTNNGFGGVLAIGCSNMGDPDPLGMEAPEQYWATHLSLGMPLVGETPDGVRELDGWTRIIATVGHARFTVLSDQKHLEVAQRVVDSARVVQVDHNGCDATSPIQDGLFPRPVQAFDMSTIGSVDAMAICQYEPRTPVDEPGLIASRLLTGTDANAELGALHVAKVGGGPDTPNTCLHSEPPDTAIVLRLNPGAESKDVYVYYDSCVHNGFDDGTSVLELTEDDCARLWGDRVLQWQGSSAAFSRCHPDQS
jgi:hypothetical protein